MSFFKKNTDVKLSEVKKNSHSLHPGDFRAIKIQSVNYKFIHQLVEHENVGSQIDVSSYTTRETGIHLINISCMEGLLLNEKRGENITNTEFQKSTKKITKGDVLISRNATLGKVSYAYKDIQGIVNGGLSFLKVKEDFKYYLMAFFISKFGEESLQNACSGGGTQKNAKREDLLKLSIPFPSYKNHTNPSIVEDIIKDIVKDILDKEEQIILKMESIDSLINNELLGNQSPVSFEFNYPKMSEIKKRTRIDTNPYCFETKRIAFLIQNYKYGYFNLALNQISGGNTPKKRIFGASTNYWFTPTTLSRGILTDKEYIKTPTYNLGAKNYVLISNRSNVGESLLYYSQDYKSGHHNQGIYKFEIKNLLDDLFTLCWFNSKLCQQYINALASGSTFKEIRMENFQNDFYIPKFEKGIKEKIVKLYFNEVEKNQEMGVYQLNRELFNQKEKLKKLVFDVVNGNIIKLQ